MDAAERWILDSVATAPSPLDALASRDGVAFTLNKRWHGLTFDELVTTLYRLFRKGDLRAERFEKLSAVSLGEFIPTRDEIIRGLSYMPPYMRKEGIAPSIAPSAVGEEVYYWLTAQGGARWEAAARPDWNKYVDATSGLDENDFSIGETIASDRKLVEQCAYFSRYIENISIIAGSEIWDILEPWQATYWKTLPIGHRLRYRFTPGEESVVVPIPPLAQQFFESINNWYSKY